MKNIKKFEQFKSIDHYQGLVLIEAIKDKNVKKVKNLIDLGYNVNCYDYLEWSPLLWAVYVESIAIIKILIKAGADIHYKAYHHIKGTRKLLDFYDLCVDKIYYDGDRKYKRIKKWIEYNYPEFVAAKKYNL